MQLWHSKKLAISSLHVTFRGIYIFMSAVSLIDVPVFLAVHVRGVFLSMGGASNTSLSLYQSETLENRIASGFAQTRSFREAPPTTNPGSVARLCPYLCVETEKVLLYTNNHFIHYCIEYMGAA